MKSLSGNKIFRIIVILALAYTQVLLPLQASAITVGGKTLNYDNPNKGNEKSPYKLNFKNVVNGELLTSLVGCTGIVNKVAAVSTTFIQDLIKTKAERVLKKQAKKQIDATKKTATGSAGALETVQSITPTGTSTGLSGNPANALKDLALNIADTAIGTEDEKDAQKSEDRIKKELAKSNFREECLNGIAVTLARNQLTAMTKATMNWINTGFNGDPQFVRNVTSFTDSIAQEILEQELSKFKDPTLSDTHPFGRDIARISINSYKVKNDFGSATASNLSNFIPGSTTAADATKTFANDFSSGGWDAWLALTTRTQNNPLGSMIVEGQHIADIKDSATQNAKDEINRNGGYLDQKKCVEYAPQKADGGDPRCLVYETVTPGTTIKDKISTYVNSPERQLEMAKTINDSLNALFTALINKFQTQGLSSLGSGNKTDFATVSGGLGSNSIATILSSGLDGLNDGGSYTDPTDLGTSIDITKDLGSIIQIQKDYIDAVKKYLKITIGVLPALGKLDYCIPGPNPNWKANADEITVYMDGVQESRLALVKPSTYSNRWKSRKKNRQIRAEADGKATQAVLDQLEKEEVVLKARAKDYEARVNVLYGPKSPMQTPTLDNINQNPAWLPMSQVGLNMTKDISLHADNIAQDTEDYTTSMADVSGYIYQLNKIKKKVDAIVKDAQKRNDEDRKKNGLPPIEPICRITTTQGITKLDENIDVYQAAKDIQEKIRTGLNPYITDKMRSDLQAFGYTDEQIDALSESEAQTLLKKIYGQ